MLSRTLVIASACVVYAADLVINEVADKGNDNELCAGEDFIELKYVAPPSSPGQSLIGMVLVDDKGHGDEDQYVLGGTSCPQALTTVNPTLVLCKEEGVYLFSAAGQYTSFSECASFEFGIGDDDTISLHQNVYDSSVLDTTGELPDTGEFFDDFAPVDLEDIEDWLEEVTSYCRVPDATGPFTVCSRTPGAKNKAAGPSTLLATDDDGMNFFNVASSMSC